VITVSGADFCTRSKSPAQRRARLLRQLQKLKPGAPSPLSCVGRLSSSHLLHNKAQELLAEIRAGQRERNEPMLAVFGEVLKAAKAIDVDSQSAAKPWSPVRRRYETGKIALEMIDAHGGLADLLAEHEALAAHHGGNHLPLLERFYRSSRGLLLRPLNVLEFEATSTDHRLLHAVEWVKANQNRTSEYVTDQVRITDPDTGIPARERLDTTFAPEAWQKVIRDKRYPGKLAAGILSCVCCRAWLMSWSAATSRWLARICMPTGNASCCRSPTASPTFPATATRLACPRTGRTSSPN
jgi:hypothetical protein